MAFLKPNDELVISVALVAIEYGIFAQGTPNLADVRADEPSVAPGSSSMNTYKAVNTAFITSAGVTLAIAALAKSRTVFIIGGAVALAEAWKYHFHNFGPSLSKDASGAMG